MTFKIIADTFSVARDSNHFIQLKSVKKPPSDDVVWLALEIVGDSKYAKATAQKILETIEEVYFDGTNAGVYERFENTLKEINLIVANLNEKRGTKGVGDISAIIAVLSGDELHLTQSKNAEAYLLRKGKFSLISEGLSGRSQDIFVNIASGEILPDDKIIFATSRLLRLATNSQLAHIFSDGVSEALDAIKELVLGDDTLNLGVACVHTKIPQVKPGVTFSEVKSSPALQKVKNWFSGMGDSVSGAVSDRLTGRFGDLNLSRNNILIALGVVVVLLGLSVSILVDTQRSRALREEYRLRIESLNQDIHQANTKGYANDKETANSILEKVEKEARDILATNYFRAEVLTLLEKIQETRDSINNTDRIKDLAPYVDLSTKKTDITARGFVNLDGNFFAYDINTLYQVILNQVLNPKPIDANEAVISAAAIEDQKVVIMMTQAGRMIEVNSDGEISPVNTEDSAWKTGVAVGAYGRNIYVLNPEKNQIYKYSRLRNNYSPASDWNLDADLNNAIGMTIDGNIYILKKGGEIVKMYKSKKEAFTIEALGADLSNVSKIYTSAEINHIYLLDPVAKKVIVVEKAKSGNGIYRAQYIFEKIGDIKDIYVNKAEDKLYLLTGKEIYQVEI